jgi:hypothetical protein
MRGGQTLEDMGGIVDCMPCLALAFLNSGSGDGFILIKL